MEQSGGISNSDAIMHQHWIAIKFKSVQLRESNVKEHFIEGSLQYK